MPGFKRENRKWKEYRTIFNIQREVDMHFNDHYYDEDSSREYDSYDSKMARVYDITMDALKKAQQDNLEYIMFTHGWSTSRRGKTTARSVVRGIMRSKESTPYIIKSKCIQHNSVFVAAIRPLPAE